MSESVCIANPKVLMIGTHPDSRGGISSVIRMYDTGGLFQKVLYMASYKDGKGRQKIIFYGLFLIRFFKVLLTQPSIKLVHIHTASYFSFFRKSIVVLLSALFGKKIILHVHGAEFILFYQNGSWLLKAWIQAVLKKCDCLLALSYQWQKDLRLIAPTSDIRVVYNPTIVRTVDADDRSLDAQSPVKFLFMGRIGKRKGVYDILESLRYIQSRNFEIHLYGDGDLTLVEALIQKNQLQAQVKLNGWIDGDTKDRVFRQADVLLLPSYNEGLPISVLEALSYGLPVLSTCVGGISEAVEEGVNGFLIQPGQCKVLGEYIERLSTSAAMRKRMGQSGYELAKSRFDLPIIIHQLEALYREFTEFE
jgi:glycosyltransferase involved in cell wall biosynthesis